jgi:hypothetical protein
MRVAFDVDYSKWVHARALVVLLESDRDPLGQISKWDGLAFPRAVVLSPTTKWVKRMTNEAEQKSLFAEKAARYGISRATDSNIVRSHRWAGRASYRRCQ